MKGHSTPMFITAMSIRAKQWKEPWCPSTDEWIKMWFIYTMDYYSAIRKDEYLLLHWHGTGGDCAKWNQSGRERQLPYGFTHMWKIKNRVEDHREGRENGMGWNQRGRQTMRDSGLRETNEGKTGWLVLRRACVGMSTGCYVQLINHWTLQQKFMMYYILSNNIINFI